MARPKKIALLFHSFAIKGGAGNVIMWLASALAARGFEATVFTAAFDPNLWPKELLSDFSIRIIPNFSPRILVKRSSVLKRRLYGRYFSKALRGFDVIVPNNNPSIQWVHTAKKLNGDLGKVLWFCHEPTRRLFGALTDRHFFDYERYSSGNSFNEHIAQAVRKSKLRGEKKSRRRERNARWEIEAAEAASTIITNSHFCAQNIEKVFSKKAVVIYPGILPSDNSKAVTSAWQSGKYICYVGHLSVMKNVDNLVEAFRILCQNGVSKDIALKIVGEGPRRPALEEKVERFGLQDRVIFLGHLPDEELPGFFENALLTVYVPIDEPFGLVPLESLCRRTPVVVSDHGGPGEVLTNKENAYLVNPLDPEEIAEAIARSLENKEEARRLAENGAALVESSLTFERFVDEFERFF